MAGSVKVNLSFTTEEKNANEKRCFNLLDLQNTSTMDINANTYSPREALTYERKS